MTADPAQPDDRPTALSSLIPRSSSFELGWVMAQLFDPRRFEPLNTRTFNPSIQLPMTSNLDPAERQKVAIAQLHTLIRPLPRVTDKRILLAAATRPFDRARFDEEIRSFHLALLEAEVASFAELSAYHLGIALSDLCWTHTPDRGPDSFLRAFGRGELAELQVLLRASSEVLPPLTAATVNKSLEAWGDWTDVTAGYSSSGWASVAAPVLTALRVQGDIWHQLLSVQTVDDDEADRPRQGRGRAPVLPHSHCRGAGRDGALPDNRELRRSGQGMDCHSHDHRRARRLWRSLDVQRARRPTPSAGTGRPR